MTRTERLERLERELHERPPREFSRDLLRLVELVREALGE